MDLLPTCDPPPPEREQLPSSERARPSPLEQPPGRPHANHHGLSRTEPHLAGCPHAILLEDACTHLKSQPPACALLPSLEAALLNRERGKGERVNRKGG